jgi:hypothetical protein
MEARAYGEAIGIHDISTYILTLPPANLRGRRGALDVNNIMDRALVTGSGFNAKWAGLHK